MSLCRVAENRAAFSYKGHRLEGWLYPNSLKLFNRPFSVNEVNIEDITRGSATYYKHENVQVQDRKTATYYKHEKVRVQDTAKHEKVRLQDTAKHKKLQVQDRKTATYYKHENVRVQNTAKHEKVRVQDTAKLPHIKNTKRCEFRTPQNNHNKYNKA